MTREGFVRNLSPVQKELLGAHFNTLYACDALGEHELNITYLAWLVGKELLHFGNDLIMADPGVEFNEKDYEITFEDETLAGGINLELTDAFYNLDRIYTILVLSA
jgi:hypothetical protein